MPHHFVLELVGLAIFIAPETHERLARGDSPNPAPEAPLLAVLADAPAHLEKGLLQHVLGVLGRPADSASQVVDRHLERPEELLEGARLTCAGSGNDRIGIGEQVRIHQKRPCHGYLKMPWCRGSLQARYTPAMPTIADK